MKGPGWENGQDFYCAPAKDAEEVDLHPYDDLQQLDLEGCTKIKIKDNFIPNMVKFINICDTPIKTIDLHGMDNLEQLQIDNVVGLTIVDDYIPPCTQYIQACGNSCKNFVLNPITDLEEVRFTNNLGLKIDEKMPSKLSVFDAEGVDFGTIDFTACSVIFVVCINSGVCVFDKVVDRLELVKLGKKEIKGEQAKEFAKSSNDQTMREEVEKGSKLNKEIGDIEDYVNKGVE